MNNEKIEFSFADGVMSAKWQAHAFDDEMPDELIDLVVSWPAESVDDRYAQKYVKGLLTEAYDNWIDDASR